MKPMYRDIGGGGGNIRSGSEGPSASSLLWWLGASERLHAGDHIADLLSAASRLEQIDMVKEGLPARILTLLASDMQIPRERLYDWLGIARTTANRKVSKDLLLSQDESERLLGMARLVDEVRRIVTESGEPGGFAAARWTADWLEDPCPALGGRKPAAFMDTADGRALVSGLIAQMQSGAYA